jgi:ketosteroid isomerase-like protein
MQDPNFSLTFEPDEVVVAGSGDLAYETGTYAITLSDTKKKPSTEKGHYVVVWQKQADGAWKAVRDVPVSDPPEDAAKK